MEFIAIALLLPFIWSSNTSTPVPPRETETVMVSVPAEVLPIEEKSAAKPRLESVDGKWIVRPPEDGRFTMTVVEFPASQVAGAKARGPASVGARRIDVIVSAP